MNTTVRLVTLAGLALALAGCASTGGPSKATLIAHRGHLAKDPNMPCAPENTLKSFREAVNSGFGFECDIRYTKDGRVFTMHDAGFHRCFGLENEDAASMTWDAVSKLVPYDQTHAQHPDTRAALFEEVCELARPDRQIFVELKTGPEIVPLVKAILSQQETATPDNMAFISFRQETVRAVKDILPQYKVFLLMPARHAGGKDKDGNPPPPYTAEECLAVLRACGADGLDFQFDAYIPEQGRDFVKAIRDAGFECHCWTVDTTEEVEKAFANGAMTVTSNRGALILNELAARQPRTSQRVRDMEVKERFLSAPGLNGF